MIVHVMREVQLREEEYEFVKGLSAHIDGLLPSAQLARRERRLLWHGELTCSRVDVAHGGDQGSCERGASSVLSPSLGRNGAHRTPTIILSPCPDPPNSEEHKWWSASNLKGKDKDMQFFTAQISIFTDIILLAEQIRQGVGGNVKTSYRLVQGVGIAKVLELAFDSSSG